MKIIEVFRKALSDVEGVFGKEWLEKARPNRKHPIQKLWRDASSAVQGMPGNLDSLPLDKLADLAEIARDLREVSQIDGFVECWLSPFKKDPKQYRSFLYESAIAARHRRMGQSVAFIPRLSKEQLKTCDIAIGTAASQTRIECKYRERIKPTKVDASLKDAVVERMQQGLGAIKRNCHIMLAILGQPSMDASQLAIDLAVSYARAGKSGIGRHATAEIWFSIKNRPPPPSGEIGSLRGLPSDLRDNGSVSFFGITAQRTPNGLMKVSRWISAEIFFFSSNSFKQIASSMDRARKQATEDRIAVYVDVDPAAMKPETLKTYLQLMQRALSDHLWKGGQNTRIGAFAISAGPVRIAGHIDGVKASENRRMYVWQVGKHAIDSKIHDVFEPR